MNPATLTDSVAMSEHFEYFNGRQPTMYELNRYIADKWADLVDDARDAAKERNWK